MKYLISFLIATFVGSASAQSKIENPRPHTPIPNSHFGMHLRYGANTVNWPSQKFYSWRVITPETEWRGLEPRKGQWQFAALDNAVYRANFRNMEVILTLGQTPQWASARPNEIVPNGPGASAEPADIRDWENYIRTVATRYKGRIKYYELWNEPRFLEVDPYRAVAGFTGSAKKMVEMGRVVKRVLSEIDPDAKLISPSTDSGLHGIKRLEAWLAAGGGEISDVIGYHIYVTPPEKIPEVAAELRKVVNKFGLPTTEIWNTESGFLIESTDKKVIADGYEVFSEVLPIQKGAAYVARSVILGAVSGLDRFYWYAWDIPGMALTEGKGKTVNQAGEAYLKTVKWIRGATLPSCVSQNKTIWTCTLARGSRVAHIAWNTGTERNWEVPAAWKAVRLEELNGNTSTLHSKQTVTLADSPVLLQSDELPWGTDND
ncbi:endo-1,4-beta-xylanase [Rhodoferax mekongensis]|uniref:endo-1,4-beta-xylanase n=1 Tax=Rhodoferax mekongensis TaxID=3068341 RepID=UPI0028BEFA21|nr:endo-1,4-beta-xylanase [Rhodoferax sp. TBRC 17199]MDT7516457.1 endo-1,4-beta-xylanase [Rhodoferax sp. TBRC 17199]